MVRSPFFSEPDGTPRHPAHIADHPRLVQARVHGADARRAHADIAYGAGLVDPGVNRADPWRTDAASDAWAWRTDTDARVNCSRRSGLAHDHGAQQECTCIPFEFVLHGDLLFNT
ncbi:MAG TPA: hypothetical protein VK857_03860 [Desulforhopalus sp.]|nr:hypothetical protein [Desulforhopalus sp.]